MNKPDILARIKHGLIVSCQALEGEPLHSSYIMSRMAAAAKEGGASGIRSNSFEDVIEIKKAVDLPVIGIKKTHYSDSEVIITPTMEDIEVMIAAGSDIVALDATKRYRPNGEKLEDLYHRVRQKYPDQLLMADISDYEEGKFAYELGFDLVSSTLAGYTEYTAHRTLPDFELLTQLSKLAGIVLIAEGGIWTPSELAQAFETGIYAAVVGTAITRPRDITKHFIEAINSKR